MRIQVAVLLWLGFAGFAFAQALPFHLDPSARDEARASGSVPAIRILTSTDFPPFNYRDTNGQLIGYHLDLAKAICDELEISCTVQAWPWDQIADALADNHGDAMFAGLAISEVTGEQFDFSNIYLMLPGRFVALSQSDEIFDPTKMVGKKVAVRNGSAHAAFLAKYLDGVQQVSFETEVEALEALKNTDVDAYFGDAMRASFWLSENEGSAAFVGEPYFNSKMFGHGLAIATPIGRDAVREAINFALVRLQKNGKLDELYLRWFPISFY